MTKAQELREQRKANGYLPLTLQLSTKYFEVNRVYYRWTYENTEVCLDKWGHKVYDDIDWGYWELLEKWHDVQGIDEADAYWHK